MGDWRAAQYYGSQGVPQDVNMMRGLPQQYAQPPLRGYSYGQTQPVPMNVPSRPYQPEPRSAYNYNVGQPRMPPPPQYRTQPQSYPVRRYSSDHAPAVYAPPPRSVTLIGVCDCYFVLFFYYRVTFAGFTLYGF